MTAQPSKVKVSAPKPYLPFPVDALPTALRELAEAGAASLGCDPAFVALPALSAAAGLVGNARRLALKSGWTEPCVVWTAVVAESGSLKTPAFGLATAPMGAMQRERIEAFDAEREQYKIAKDAYDRSKKNPNGALGQEPKRPALQRLYCQDVTAEALAAVLSENPRGVLVKRDELSGWLKSFNQYKSRGGADLSCWLEAFNAGSWCIDRKGSNGERVVLHVPHAAVCVAGGVQPGVLRRELDLVLKTAGSMGAPVAYPD